jgi:hypothetical protein
MRAFYLPSFALKNADIAPFSRSITSHDEHFAWPDRFSTASDGPQSLEPSHHSKQLELISATSDQAAQGCPPGILIGVRSVG